MTVLKLMIVLIHSNFYLYFMAAKINDSINLLKFLLILSGCAKIQL